MPKKQLMLEVKEKQRKLLNRTKKMQRQVEKQINKRKLPRKHRRKLINMLKKQQRQVKKPKKLLPKNQQNKRKRQQNKQKKPKKSSKTSKKS